MNAPSAKDILQALRPFIDCYIDSNGDTSTLLELVNRRLNLEDFKRLSNLEDEFLAMIPTNTK